MQIIPFYGSIIRFSFNVNLIGKGVQKFSKQSKIWQNLCIPQYFDHMETVWTPLVQISPEATFWNKKLLSKRYCSFKLTFKITVIIMLFVWVFTSLRHGQLSAEWQYSFEFVCPPCSREDKMPVLQPMRCQRMTGDSDGGKKNILRHGDWT